MNPLSFYSNGKLLITGEYLVLDGALSLAVPVRFGQFLEVSEGKAGVLSWKANDPSGTWLEVSLKIPSLEMISASHTAAGKWLQSLLEAAVSLNPGFLKDPSGYEVTTDLNYNRFWGLGSSSTLIYNVALWSGTEPFELFRKVSKGSGYDIACAPAGSPLFYRFRNGNPMSEPVIFRPLFHDHIFFVYLGRKQDSEAGIEAYRKIHTDIPGQATEEVTDISRKMAKCDSQEEFMQLMSRHESIISRITGWPVLKEKLFRDLPGEAKSLGAWGGDFAMVCSTLSGEATKIYLESKGFNTFFTFEDLILNNPA